MTVLQRLFGLETEYAFSVLGVNGSVLDRDSALDRLLALARKMPYLPDRASSGVFFANGARFYKDCGHPEMTTPEVASPGRPVATSRLGSTSCFRWGNNWQRTQPSPR